MNDKELDEMIDMVNDHNEKEKIIENTTNTIDAVKKKSVKKKTTKKKSIKKKVVKKKVDEFTELKTFKQILRDDTLDFVYMSELKMKYEERYPDTYKDNVEYHKIANKVSMLRTELEKKEAAAVRQEESNRKAKEFIEKGSDKDQLTQAWINTLRDEPIWLIGDENKYYLFLDGKTGWVPLISESAMMRYGAIEPQDRTAFKIAVKELGKVKVKAKYSFHADTDGVKEDEILLLTNRDSWLKPVKGDVPLVFDILMMSLSDGVQEAADHIQKVFVRKYLHPEDYQIPTICFSGKEGAGKNLGTVDMGSIIFGEYQSKAVSADSAFGQWNDSIDGLTICLVDEISAKDEYTDKAKSIFWNRTMEIRKRGVSACNKDNTPLWFIAGNDRLGSMMLSKTGDNRRYSVITHSRDLIDHTMRVFPELSRQGAIDWWNAHKSELKNPVAVAAWLERAISQFGEECEKPLIAYQGEDYQRIIKMQETPREQFCRVIFNDDSFTHISSRDIWTTYVAWCKDSGVPQKYWSDKHHTMAVFEEWIVSNKVPVSKQVGYAIKSGEGVRNRKSEYGFTSIIDGKAKKYWGFCAADLKKYFKKSDTGFVTLGSRMEQAMLQEELKSCGEWEQEKENMLKNNEEVLQEELVRIDEKEEKSTTFDLFH